MRKVGVFALAGLILLATLGGCKRETTTSKQEAAVPAGIAADCNVIVISMDTTRADRLGCYGRARAVTPALDAIAQRGVRFTDAFAHVPSTLPSHANLLTGAYPPETGIRINGRTALGPELATLPEPFKEHGYSTAAFLASAVLDARYGLDRGFDVYDDRIATPEDKQRPQRPAQEVCDRALDWLNAHADGRFMCLVHFYDPHTPYLAPPEFVKRTVDPYDAEVAYMDSQIARIASWLDEHALRDKTLLVVVADHGESLGEHGYPWHSLLVYDAIVHIPVLFSLPGRLPEGTTVDGLIRMVDIMPTVIELMGWARPAGVSGESLRVALGGGPMAPRTCYGETDYPYDSFGWSKLRFLVDGNWKYIRAPEPELYDLAEDPKELRNLAAALPDRVKAMEAALAACEGEMTQRQGDKLELSSQELRALRNLGYIPGPSSPPEDRKPLKNPRDMADILWEYRKAEALLSEHKAMEAIEILEPLVERSPESFALLELLGKAYGAADMQEEAQRTLTTALAIHPDSAETHAVLAGILYARGALPAAAEACDKALSLEPNQELALLLRPRISTALNAQRAEIAALREAITTNADSPEPFLRLGNLLVRSGQTAEGVGILKQAVARYPQDAALANTLAWYLATAPNDELRDGSAALQLAQRACEGTGESDPTALDTLAAALAEVGRFDEAAETAERAAALAAEAGDDGLATRVARRARLYRARQPFRSPL